MSLSVSPSPASLVTSVRQLVLHGLLFILLMVFTTGLASLITSALRGFGPDAFGYNALPLALSSVVIAGPLAWLLWRRIQRFLAERGERDSPIWALQAAVVYVIGTAAGAHYTSAVLGQLAGLRSTVWEEQLGYAMAWTLLAVWQYRILRDERYAPLVLRNLGWLIAAFYCVIVAVLSLAALLGVAIRQFMPAGTELELSQAGDLSSMSNIAVWVMVNFLVFAWHWFVVGLRDRGDDLTKFMLVLAVGLATVAMLLGKVFVLASVLPIPADVEALTSRMADSLPLAAGFALAGALAWLYFSAVLAQSTGTTREAGRQVVSGIALSIGATGFGMIINALLAAIDPPLAGNSPADLLRIGLSLFVVGAVMWLVYWRPASAAPAEARRIYLVLVFGVSAVVALVALLVVGYRVFAYFITPDQAGPSLIGEIRASLGLLLATGAVFAYHFTVWRTDRDHLAATAAAAPVSPPAAEPPARRTLASILLVTDVTNGHLAGQLERATGVRVQHMIRTDSSAKPIPDVQVLVDGISSLPAGTGQALVILNGEYTMFLPLQDGSRPAGQPQPHEENHG